MGFCETKSKKPCGACPFKRVNTNEKPNPGGSHPFVYLGQTRGPFWLPCHQDKNYKGKGSLTDTVSQCRGAAIFRSNCETGIRRPEQLLTLPQNKEEVFSNEKEFLIHYLDMSDEDASTMSMHISLDAMMNFELYKTSSTRRILE